MAVDLTPVVSILNKIAALGVPLAATEIKKTVTDQTELAVIVAGLSVFASFATELGAALTPPPG